MAREDWIVLRGGPMDGWVYDTTRAEREMRALEAARVSYNFTEEFEMHEDGLPVRVYRYWHAVDAPWAAESRGAGEEGGEG